MSERSEFGIGEYPDLWGIEFRRTPRLSCDGCGKPWVTTVHEIDPETDQPNGFTMLCRGCLRRDGGLG